MQNESNVFNPNIPAIGPSEIVFENGGQLYLLDLATEEYKEVDVEVVIGVTGAPGLIDDGGITVPTFRMCNADGKRPRSAARARNDFNLPDF